MYVCTYVCMFTICLLANRLEQDSLCAGAYNTRFCPLELAGPSFAERPQDAMDDKNLNAKPPSRPPGLASSTDDNGGAVQPHENLTSEATTTPLPFMETPGKEDDNHGSTSYTACQQTLKSNGGMRGNGGS